MRSIAGKTLACFCAEPEDAVLLPDDPLRCHAQILLRIANRLAGAVETDAEEAPHEAAAPDLAAFLANPSPEFLGQAHKYVQDGSPEGLLKKLVTVAAYEVFNNPRRRDEADGPVREWAATFMERA